MSVVDLAILRLPSATSAFDRIGSYSDCQTRTRDRPECEHSGRLNA